MKEWDYSKLPKWAQGRFDQLEGNVEWYKERLRQVGEGDSEVWVRNYIDGDQALPKGSSVIFKLDDGEVDVSVRDGYLELHAMASRGRSNLWVHPVVANVVKVKVGE